MSCCRGTGQRDHWRSPLKPLDQAPRGLGRMHTHQIGGGQLLGNRVNRLPHRMLTEFIRFLNVIEKQVPVGKTIHAIVDNYATHKHPNVRRWLERHPRRTFHFTPTSASWLNAVEGLFATFTKRRLKHGVFRSVADLQAAINRFLEEHNQQSQPFTWARPSRQNHRRRNMRAPSVRFDPPESRKSGGITTS
jgi:transposase